MKRRAFDAPLADLTVEPIAPDRQRALRIFTVDVEDWFHGNFTSAPDVDTLSLPRRVEAGVSRTLELLASSNARATFFVLGVVAEEHPTIVRRIAEAGHEIGCHSFAHELVYEQRVSTLIEDLARARAVLQDQSGQPVAGFRAPSWSLTRKSLWAVDVIAEAGFTYDSSIFPVANYLYGIDGAPTDPYRLRTPSGNALVEIPPVTVGAGQRRLGVGGGFYLRALPLPVHQLALRRTLARGFPFVAYTHPRELDPDAWSQELELSPKEKFIHRFGMKQGLSRLRHLLRKGEWVPMGEYVRAVTGRGSAGRDFT